MGHNIMAAKPLIKKSVLCIDNVDKSVTVEDMHSFVVNMSVNVISLFETKPRRRRLDIAVPDHKAFRLCIPMDDRDRLRDASKWPSYISVSEWFFKSAPTSKHQPGTAIVQHSMDTNVEHEDMGFGVFDDDHQSTIIVNYDNVNIESTSSVNNGV